MACPLSKTADGFEIQFGTNYLGPYHLTKKLLPLLESSGTKENPARVVNLSSCAALLFAPNSGILFNDLSPSSPKSYNTWTRYGHSKLAQILSAMHMQTTRKSENVGFVSLHPGVISSTNLMQYAQGNLQVLWQLIKAVKLSQIGSLFFGGKTIPEGTSTTMVCALDPKIEFGKFYDDCQIATKLHPHAYDMAMAQKLTKVSDEMIETAIAAIANKK
jgi:NAD(P)-dependent dehydrogenase (short-subunit alcohol dehydrogenase family)